MTQEMGWKGIRIALGWSLLSGVCIFAFFVSSENLDIIYAVVPIIFFVIFSGIAMRQWLIVFRKKHLEGIDAFCNLASDPLLMKKHIENIWSNGIVITKRCRTDREYLVFGDGKRSMVIPLGNIVQLFCVKALDSGPRDPGRWRMDVGIVLQNGTGEILRIFSQTWLFLSSEGIFKNVHNEMSNAEKILYNHFIKYHPNVLLGADKDLLAVLEQYVKEKDIKEVFEKYVANGQDA